MNNNNPNDKLSFFKQMKNIEILKKARNKNQIKNELYKKITQLEKEENTNSDKILRIRKEILEIDNNPYYVIDQNEIDEMLSRDTEKNSKKTLFSKTNQNCLKGNQLSSAILRLSPNEKIEISQLQSIQSNTIDEYELILSSKNKKEPHIYKLDREIVKDNCILKYTNYIYGKIDFEKLQPQQVAKTQAEISDFENYRAALCDFLSKNKLENLLVANNGNFGSLTKNKYNAYVRTKMPDSPVLDKYLKGKNHISFKRLNSTRVLAYEIGQINIYDKDKKLLHSLEQYVVTRANQSSINTNLVYAHINFKQLSQPNEMPNNYTNAVQSQLFSENNIQEKYLGSVSETDLYVKKSSRLRDMIAPNKFQNLNFDSIDIP